MGKYEFDNRRLIDSTLGLSTRQDLKAKMKMFILLLKGCFFSTAPDCDPDQKIRRWSFVETWVSTASQIKTFRFSDIYRSLNEVFQQKSFRKHVASFSFHENQNSEKKIKPRTFEKVKLFWLESTFQSMMYIFFGSVEKSDVVKTAFYVSRGTFCEKKMKKKLFSSSFFGVGANNFRDRAIQIRQCCQGCILRVMRNILGGMNFWARKMEIMFLNPLIQFFTCVFSSTFLKVKEKRQNALKYCSAIFKFRAKIQT